MNGEGSICLLSQICPILFSQIFCSFWVGRNFSLQLLLSLHLQRSVTFFCHIDTFSQFCSPAFLCCALYWILVRWVLSFSVSQYKFSLFHILLPFIVYWYTFLQFDWRHRCSDTVDAAESVSISHNSRREVSGWVERRRGRRRGKEEGEKEREEEKKDLSVSV